MVPFCLTPNPPKDGITAGERGMRNLGRAIGRTRFRQVEPERPAVALWGVPAAVCIAARDGMAVMERSGGHSRTVVARVGGDVQLAGTLGHWRTGAVRLGVEWLAIERGRD